MACHQLGPSHHMNQSSLQNKCRTADPDWQNLGRSGKLSFFIIYKFGKIVLRSGKFQILFLKTAKAHFLSKFCTQDKKTSMKFESKYRKFSNGFENVICKMAATLLTHLGRDEMDTISQTTFSNVFSSTKMFEFRLRFHWSLFLKVKLTILQHWFK